VEALDHLTLGTPPARVVKQWGGATLGEDTLAHQTVEQYQFYFGAPAPVPATAAAPAARPASLDECTARLAAAQARLERRRVELAGFLPPSARFAVGTAEPSLGAQVQAAVDRALGPGTPVECRSSVCRLRLAAPDPGALARLRAAPIDSVIRKTETVGADLFLTIGDEGGVALAHLREPTRAPGFFTGCPEPAQPGTVMLRIVVPATGAGNDDGRVGHSSVRLAGGSLAASAAATCLRDRFAAVVAEADLPTPVGGLLRFESWTWRPGQPPSLSTPER
jgi:hypothetical protein